MHARTTIAHSARQDLTHILERRHTTSTPTTPTTNNTNITAVYQYQLRTAVTCDERRAIPAGARPSGDK